MTEAFKELNSFGWNNVILIFLLSIVLAVALLQSFRFIIDYFGIETKQSLKEKERDSKIKSLESKVSALEQSANKFNQDRTHDRQQSLNIQHNLTDNLSQISAVLDEIKADLIEERVERKRLNILNFADELRHNDWDINIERFDNVLRDYDDYERIIHERHMTNGFAEESIRFIRSKYQEKLNS